MQLSQDTEAGESLLEEALEGELVAFREAEFVMYGRFLTTLC